MISIINELNRKFIVEFNNLLKDYNNEKLISKEENNRGHLTENEKMIVYNEILNTNNESIFDYDSTSSFFIRKILGVPTKVPSTIQEINIVDRNNQNIRAYVDKASKKYVIDISDLYKYFQPNLRATKKGSYAHDIIISKYRKLTNTGEEIKNATTKMLKQLISRSRGSGSIKYTILCNIIEHSKIIDKRYEEEKSSINMTSFNIDELIKLFGEGAIILQKDAHDNGMILKDENLKDVFLDDEGVINGFSIRTKSSLKHAGYKTCRSIIEAFKSTDEMKNKIWAFNDECVEEINLFFEEHNLEFKQDENNKQMTKK